jgi:hypothetical protein
MTTPHQPSSFRPTADGSPAPAEQPMWRLERATHGRLDLIDAAGQRHVDVDVLRAFPASAPAGPVAVVAADGAELAWIDPLSDLDEPLRGLLEQELSQREFLPVIERIESVSDGEPMEWSVVTDRGLRRFTVGHIDDIVYAPDGSVSITDSVGVRYAIPQLSRLDSRSRRLLDRLD